MRWIRGLCLVPVLVLLAACRNGAGLEPAASAPAASGAGFPAKEPPKASGAGACSWPFVSDPDLLNLAFPDEAATYWVSGPPS